MALALARDPGQQRVALRDRRIDRVGRAVDHRGEGSSRLRTEAVDVVGEVLQVRLDRIELRRDRGVVLVDEARHDRAVRAGLHRGHETRGPESDDDRGDDPDAAEPRAWRTRWPVRAARPGPASGQARADPGPSRGCDPVAGRASAARDRPANTSPRVR